MNIYTYSIHNFKCEAIHLCHECNREFKSERSLRSHKNHHNENYRNRKISTKEALSAILLIHKCNSETAKNNYNLNPRICQECNNAIPFKGGEKFCSKSCAAKFNSRIISKESRAKGHLATKE